VPARAAAIVELLERVLADTSESRSERTRRRLERARLLAQFIREDSAPPA
jgi:hypothetical protein